MIGTGLKNKIWLIISSIFAFATLFAWYGSTKPVFYESKTTLTFRPPMISSKVVESLTEDELEQKLAGMGRDILSRSYLEPIIAKYKLFEIEKAKGMPMESIVDRMQKNIRIEPQKERIEVVGFSITYRDSTPENARNVAAELANKYVNAQVSTAVSFSVKTKEFIENELIQARVEFKKLERERVKTIEEKTESSKGDHCFSVSKIETLYSQKEAALDDKEKLIRKKNLLDEKSRTLNSQLFIVKQFIRDDPDLKTAKRATLNQIKSLTAEKRDAEKEISKLESVSKMLDEQIRYLTNEYSKLERQIFNNHPNLKKDLAEIDAKRQTAKLKFEELTKKADEFCNDCDWETPLNDISIQIIDPANFPSSPKSFTTKGFALIGTGFGFVFGLFLLGLGSGVRYLNNKFGKVVLQ